MSTLHPKTSSWQSTAYYPSEVKQLHQVTQAFKQAPATSSRTRLVHPLPSPTPASVRRIPAATHAHLASAHRRADQDGMVRRRRRSDHGRWGRSEARDRTKAGGESRKEVAGGKEDRESVEGGSKDLREEEGDRTKAAEEEERRKAGSEGCPILHVGRLVPRTATPSSCHIPLQVFRCSTSVPLENDRAAS